MGPQDCRAGPLSLLIPCQCADKAANGTSSHIRHSTVHGRQVPSHIAAHNVAHTWLLEANTWQKLCGDVC